MLEDIKSHEYFKDKDVIRVHDKSDHIIVHVTNKRKRLGYDKYIVKHDYIVCMYNNIEYKKFFIRYILKVKQHFKPYTWLCNGQADKNTINVYTLCSKKHGESIREHYKNIIK